MQLLHRVRKEYGDTFATIFNDGLIIPWKPLSLGSFIKYTQDKKRELIPPSHLEDEIFKLCVQDKSILRRFNHLNAGVITTVVLNIWEYSGPTGVSSFNEDLEGARYLISSGESRALHDLVMIITMAFPYKPEEVYDMDYQTFLIRLAQSEKKLLQLGIFLQEPISLESESEGSKKIQEKDLNSKKPDREKKIDIKKLYEEQQQPNSEKSMSTSKWWKKSPVLEATKKHNINFEEEAAEQFAFGMTGHEKADAHIGRAKMVEDARIIYKDLLESLEEKKKV